MQRVQPTSSKSQKYKQMHDSWLSQACKHDLKANGAAQVCKEHAGYGQMINKRMISPCWS